MMSVRRSAVVPYNAKQMFALVNDVAAYPEFLPWCSDAKILEQSDTEMVASIEVSAAGASKSFTTRNTLEAPNKIQMEHVDGPFKSLLGIWQFRAQDNGHCKVELELDFEVEGGLKAAFFGMLFNKATDKMVTAFCERADHVYGHSA